MVEVGRLKKVELRDVWKHEAHDFTPWLMDNSEVLGDALGLEIEFTTSEQQVGPYKVDIIGKDLTHDSVLIVENQLGKTDHGHLGQLITYAANTDAVTVVWIAKQFSDEHRQAIDYMNTLAGDSSVARFYAVQVSAVQIGNSPPAALLELVAQPNVNSVRGGWGSLVLVIDNERIPRCEFYIRGRENNENIALFDYLKADREEIEKEFGAPLVWDEQDHLVSRRIMSKRKQPVDIQDINSHNSLIDWLLGEHIKFKEIMLPRVHEYAER